MRKSDFEMIGELLKRFTNERDSLKEKLEDIESKQAYDSLKSKKDKSGIFKGLIGHER